MKRYFLLINCLLIASLNFNLFLNPHNLVTGGTQGLSIIINKILNINPSTTIFLINITFLIISYIFLKKETTISIIISSLIYPSFIKLTSIISIPSIIENNILLSSIIAGIICGITNGLIFKANHSTGGITVLSNILHTYSNIKISISNFIINTIIIVIGCIYFGIIKLLYALIVVIISSLIIHHIMKKNLTIPK